MEMSIIRKYGKVLALILLLMLCVSSASAEKLVGGWQIVPAEAGALPEEVQEAFDKAVATRLGAEYVPVALLASQIVSGTNYCILCQITPVVPDAVPTWALVYVYADLQGNAEILNVYELYIDRHVFPGE